MKPAVIHAIFLITRSLWVRFHMTLILLVVVLVGIATNWILLRVGVRSMPAFMAAWPICPVLLISSIKRLTWASVTGFKVASCPSPGLEVYRPVTVAPKSGAM